MMSLDAVQKSLINVKVSFKKLKDSKESMNPFYVGVKLILYLNKKSVHMIKN
jgi:hypothetical protein